MLQNHQNRSKIKDTTPAKSNAVQAAQTILHIIWQEASAGSEEALSAPGRGAAGRIAVNLQKDGRIPRQVKTEGVA